MTTPLSAVQICNYALARIGSTQTITSLDDGSNEAAQCNIFYDACRQELLRAFSWPWASRYIKLTQVSENGVQANPEWGVSYRYPTDCLFIVRLIQYTQQSTTTPPQTTGPVVQVPVYCPDRSDTNPYPLPYSIGQDDDGLLVLTTMPEVWCKYTQDVTDPMRFSMDFAMLLAWRLAMELSYGLAISDSRREMAIKMYNDGLMRVRANSYNESQNDQPFVNYNSQFIRARW